MKTIEKEQILAIVRGVCEMVLPYYGNVEFVFKDSTVYNPVTELDKKVEAYLAKNLAALDASVGFVGEETGGNRNVERFWLCDPIDSTFHFIRGQAFCTTMLALVEGGQVMFSVIYDFVNDNMYVAEKGKGAMLNGKRIKVSKRPLREAMLCWETKLKNEENWAAHRTLEENAMLFKTISAGYEFAMVASGRLEGRICFDPYGSDYDFAPGALLVEEAGGKVSNLGSDTYDYRNLNFLAANPIVHEELTKLISESQAFQNYFQRLKR